MNLTKSYRCYIQMDSRWANASAVCMGCSMFLRSVYYFGLINLMDLNGFDIFMQVILPMMIAGGYLVMIKALRLNSPVLFGGLIGIYALNHMITMGTSASAIVGGLLLAATAVLFAATSMGYIPSRMPLIAVSMAALALRFLAVDLLTYILPFSQFHPVAYLPEASNLFGQAAIAAICPAAESAAQDGGSDHSGIRRCGGT